MADKINALFEGFEYGSIQEFLDSLMKLFTKLFDMLKGDAE